MQEHLFHAKAKGPNADVFDDIEVYGVSFSHNLIRQMSTVAEKIAEELKDSVSKEIVYSRIPAILKNPFSSTLLMRVVEDGKLKYSGFDQKLVSCGENDFALGSSAAMLYCKEVGIIEKSGDFAATYKRSKRPVYNLDAMYGRTNFYRMRDLISLCEM